uniref:Uncharacterized protein n=1 Tax=Myotis myotis TaxID=51298 RepID=A0A7J7XZE3_MYOMY|nr:hypothetical protein mMyoMyo1_011323 [Myotis myotis]
MRGCRIGCGMSLDSVLGPLFSVCTPSLGSMYALRAPAFIPGQDPSQELLACISSLLDVYLHLHVAVEPLTQPTESLLLLHSCHSILPGARRMLAHVVTTTPCQLCLAIPLGFPPLPSPWSQPACFPGLLLCPSLPSLPLPSARSPFSLPASLPL